MYDEYGRTITYRLELEGSLQEENYEYGDNGKAAKYTVWRDAVDGTGTDSWVFEYDSEGRLSGYTYSSNYIYADGSVLNSETTITYTYGGKGFTVHRNEESMFNGTERTIERSTTDYEIINEFGEYERMGEPYDVYREVN